MDLDEIDEYRDEFGGSKSNNFNIDASPRTGRARSESLETGKRRGSHLLASAGIDFERRRKQFHSPSLVTSGNIAPHGSETRIFQEGDQWMEEKDGKVTKLELIEVKEKMGRMRMSVPVLPVPIAIILLILNLVLPSTGTFIGAATLLCGTKCRHEKNSDGIKYGILAGFLQLILTPLLVGWIFSIYYGANIVQDALEASGGQVQDKDQNTQQQAYDA